MNSNSISEAFSLCKNGPQISRLFFVDNSQLFCRVNIGELLSIQGILALYEHTSSQQINRDKTTLFFDKYVSQDMKMAIIYLLRVLEVKGCEKYLGLPVVLVEIKGLALITSRKGCVRNLKVKRKNYCRKHEERGSDKSSRSSYSRFRYMLFLLASWSLS